MGFEWISIDPGVAYYAWAQWLGRDLRYTGIFDIQESVEDTTGDLPAVIERPRIMPGRKVRSKDVEGVLISYGRLLEKYSPVAEMAPHNVPEKIWHARILALLSPVERAIVMQQPAKVRKHTIDAVGLGLKYLGRMK